MQASSSSSLWLAALCFAPLAIVATAGILFLWSKKPHYRTLFRQWGRAAICSLLIGAIFAFSSLWRLGPGASAWVASARTARVFGFAAGAVGFAAAGAYAWALLRSADDYYARSGFRIGASTGLAGLVAQLLLRNRSAMTFGIAILIGAAGLLAIEWLWRAYPREPEWLLRTCVIILPAMSAAIVVFKAGSLRHLDTSVAVDGAVCAAGVILFLRLARRRPGCPSVGARGSAQRA
jgi:hypothetical protein